VTVPAAASFYESDRLGGLNRVFSSAQLSLYGTTKNGVTCILLNFPLTVLSYVFIVITAPDQTRDAIENSLRFEICEPSSRVAIHVDCMVMDELLM